MGGMIRCLVCYDVLHSMYRHDFQSCECSNQAFVDGGFDYQRIGGKDFDKIEAVGHKHDPKDKSHEKATINDFIILTELMEDERKAYNLKKENQNGKDIDSDTV